MISFTEDCYFDVNIFLEILWKESKNNSHNKCWEKSVKCLNHHKLKCYSSDFGLLILNYKLYGQWEDFTNILIKAKTVEEIRNLTNKYPGKETIKIFITNLIEKIEKEYWSINDAITYLIKMRLREFHDEIRNLYKNLYFINTNIRWYMRKIELKKEDDVCLLSVSGKKDIIIPLGDPRISLIHERIKRLKACLEQDEDRVNYAIAKTVMMKYFLTRDSEFFEGKTIACIERQGLDYIATTPEKLLEI